MANRIVIEVASGQVVNSGVVFRPGDRLEYLESAVNELVELGIPVESLYSILMQIAVHGNHLTVKLGGSEPSGAENVNGES